MNDFERLLMDEIKSLRDEVKEIRADVSLIKIQLANYKVKMAVIGGTLSLIATGIINYLTRHV